jgi:Fe-S cluster biogenesis protein NfuA
VSSDRVACSADCFHVNGRGDFPSVALACCRFCPLQILLHRVRGVYDVEIVLWFNRKQTLAFVPGFRWFRLSLQYIWLFVSCATDILPCILAASSAQVVMDVEGVPLTEDNVEKVMDEIRPYLMADGGNVELVEIDGLTVRLRLQGACGSCPSSMMTMKMGIERRLMEKIPEIEAVEQVMDEETGLPLTDENVENVSHVEAS